MLKINSKIKEKILRIKKKHFFKLRKSDKVKAQCRRNGIGTVGIPKEDNQSNGKNNFFNYNGNF